MKRHGFVQTASLTVATSAVTGAYWFIDKNGNSQVIVCQDLNCAHSANGGNFAVIYSTASSGVQRWQFVDYNGIVYAVDDKGDQPWSYDGTTFTQPFSTSVPLGTLIEQIKDRLVISGVSTNPSAVYYSQSGVFTNFTTLGNSADPWVDTIGTAGDKVTALKYDSGNLYIFKRNSITLCIPNDQFSTNCYPIANTIGTSTPMSIVSAPDGIYFQAQSGSYWRIPTYGLYGLELISRKIYTTVKNQASLFGSSGNNFQGSLADWNAGTQTPSGSYSTSIAIGSIDNSSYTTIDNSSNTFVNGTFNLTYISSINVVSVSTKPAILIPNGDFELGNLNNWMSTTSNAPNSYPHACAVNYQTITASNVNAIQGSYSALLQIPGCFTEGSNDCAGVMNNNQSNLQWISRVLDGNGTVLLSQNLTTDGTTHEQDLNLTSLTTNYVQLEIRGTGNGQASQAFTDVLTSNFIRLSNVSSAITFLYNSNDAQNDGNCTNQVTQNLGQIRIDSVTYNGIYYASGTYTSQTFNMQFSTTIGGPFIPSINLPANTNITFQIKSATSPTGVFDSFTSISSGTRVTELNQYWQYIATFTLSGSSPTISATLLSQTLQAATTGQFVTQCIQPGPNITAWGLLTCDTSNNIGAGSEVFYATSAVNCASLPTSPPLNAAGSLQNGWTQQTNNASLTISTNAAVYIGWRDLLGSSTDQAQINSCQTNWQNGINPQPTWGVFDPIKNAIYWSTNDSGKTNTTTNDLVLKYDLNIAGLSGYQNNASAPSPWFPLGINATALRMVNNLLYFGSSTGGTWNQYGASGSTNDNGAAINGYWQSKDFSCNAPFNDSIWNRVYTIARNQQSGTITQTTTNSLNVADTFSVVTSTSAAQNYVRSTHSLQNFTAAPFINVKFANNSLNNPFEVDGFQLDCIPQPPIDENP